MNVERVTPRFCALPLERQVRGWIVDGKLVHPLEAYTNSDDWLASFEALFPERKKKMRAYSERQGWSEAKHRIVWKQVLVPWLNKVSPNEQN